MSIAGMVSGAAGSIVKASAGTLTLSGVNTYGGTTTVNGGTLQLGNAAALGLSTGVAINNGGTLQLADPGALIAAIALNPGGTIDLNGQSPTVTPVVTITGGALTNSNATAVTYSGTLNGLPSFTVGGDVGDIELSGTDIPERHHDRHDQNRREHRDS